MGEERAVRVDVNDLSTSASVIDAMSLASADGWAAVASAQDELSEQWRGTRSAEHAYRAEQLVDRARDLLARMDGFAPDLRAAIAGYIETDSTNAALLQTRGSAE